MQIFNNVPAFMVWRSYNSNVTSLRASMSKLASGLKISSAGDDPAGLAMSERLRAQYRNTSAAASNVENKINYLQTADAWLQKVHDSPSLISHLCILHHPTHRPTTPAYWRGHQLPPTSSTAP